jgi:anthranilate phosphoribosyltransferase
VIKEGIQKLTERKNLSHDEAQGIMREIMSGSATNAQIAGFLTALRMKGETIEEITAFAKVMREFCHRINLKFNGRLIDTCGTGGDRLKTFNISTSAAFVIAGAGVAVAKHGNRSVTSKCGSADLLEKLGFNLNVEPGLVQKSIEDNGIGFMFAPSFHPAMKYAVEPRREIGIRTVFNILGPLTNPANANAQLLGVYDSKLVEPLAYVLRDLGCEEAMVVHGLDGLDEISTLGKTAIAWLKGGRINMIETTPKDFGVKQAKLENLTGATPEENVEITFKVLRGLYDRNNPKLNIVLINAAAGVIIGGKAEDFNYGVELARESVESGAAYQKLKMLIKTSRGNLSKLEELERKYG